MFSTLVESRAVRPRSARGMATSIALHSLLIAGAVALTHPTRVDARPKPTHEIPPVYVPAPTPLRDNHQPPTVPLTRQPAGPTMTTIHIPTPAIAYTTLPPIDFDGPALPPDRVVIGAGLTELSVAARGEPTDGFGGGAVLDAGVVDRVPRIIGNAPAPRYPDTLRQGGETGQVVVRFVVDTLGRAEMGDVVVVEATHPLFASAVKTALATYRFTPGEASGRKVRTLVQLPFRFTLR
ncbi:MAG: TonB family protein [Gemmatimonadota bacterium]|nr:TonB family protein [Gemmatimonadota bacterium]